MNIQRAMMFVAVLLALGGAALANGASSAPPSNPAVAVRGAQQLMEQMGRARTVAQAIPLLSNRSAAVMGMMLGDFCLTTAKFEAEDKGQLEDTDRAKAQKFQTDLDALGQRYGITPAAAKKLSQIDGVSRHGREYALAVLAAVAKDLPKQPGMTKTPDALPPASSFKYAVTRPGAVRIRMANGGNFPGTDRPYAEALWEGGQWRLDLLGPPPGERK